MIGPKGTKVNLGSCLYVRSPCHLFGRDDPGEHADKGGAGAENGVDDDREHLDETLLGRVGNVSGCSCVRSRTNAGFVGIKASLYPKHQTGSADAAQDFLEVEGIGKDSA